jgi:hypothetical protein
MQGGVLMRLTLAAILSREKKLCTWKYEWQKE